MDFEDLLEDRDPDLADLARAARALVQAVVPHARQAVQQGWGGALLFQIGMVTVCSVSAHRQHVSLHFSQGATLPDPQGLLEGTGRHARHLKLRTRADLERPGVRALVEAAWRGQPPDSAVQDALERVRALCLSFPGTSETLTHGHPTFWAGRRTFALFGLGSPSVAFKAGLGLHAQLEGDPRVTPTPYLFRRGWLSLALGEATDWDEVRSLLEQAWLGVRPASGRGAARYGPSRPPNPRRA